MSRYGFHKYSKSLRFCKFISKVAKNLLPEWFLRELDSSANSDRLPGAYCFTSSPVHWHLSSSRSTLCLNNSSSHVWLWFTLGWVQVYWTQAFLCLESEVLCSTSLFYFKEGFIKTAWWNYWKRAEPSWLTATTPTLGRNRQALCGLIPFAPYMARFSFQALYGSISESNKNIWWSHFL